MTIVEFPLCNVPFLCESFNFILPYPGNAVLLVATRATAVVIVSPSFSFREHLATTAIYMVYCASTYHATTTTRKNESGRNSTTLRAPYITNPTMVVVRDDSLDGNVIGSSWYRFEP